MNIKLKLPDTVCFTWHPGPSCIVSCLFVSFFLSSCVFQKLLACISQDAERLIHATVVDQISGKLGVVLDGQLGHCGLPCEDFSDNINKAKQLENSENVKYGRGTSGEPSHHLVRYLKWSCTPFQFWENVRTIGFLAITVTIHDADISCCIFRSINFNVCCDDCPSRLRYSQCTSNWVQTEQIWNSSGTCCAISATRATIAQSTPPTCKYRPSENDCSDSADTLRNTTRVLANPKL